MIEELVKDVSLEYLSNSRLGEKMQTAMGSFEKAQEVALAYSNDDSPRSLKAVRIGTILTLSILQKATEGKSIKSYSKNDWADIANSVAQYAIIESDERYSIFIFSMYANYIDASVEILEKVGVSQEKINAIRLIAEEVRGLTTSFQNGLIEEVDYTEQCLWLLLEGIIKILVAYATRFAGRDGAEFIESASMLAFEYARYSLYKNELELLNYYIDNQKQLDNQLEEKLEAYNKELRNRQDKFDKLLEDAFNDDFRLRLKTSIEIANQVGVDKTEILDSIDKIDEFFM